LEIKMSERMPVVFVSHGAPDALLKAPDTVACWREIGYRVRKPSAILVVSAHWEARLPTVSMATAPETLYDFSGFSPELYRMKYSAPGSPALAQRVVALLSTANIAADTHPRRGLDHGAWAPLSAMYAEARIPVVQLSLAHNASVATHLAIGQAIAPLREEGVLILASGAITHNFSWLDWHATDEQTPFPQAQIFTDWVAGRLAAQDVAALLTYRDTADGAGAHPTEEHFMPLFVALGAAGNDIPKRYSPHFTYGAMAMDAYLWEASAASRPA
jgi:4,5-DOPA dioxygenase extradiol